jgi:hypothetical protein
MFNQNNITMDLPNITHLLVGGLEHVLFFHSLGKNHPTEGLKPPTGSRAPGGD